MLFGVSAQGFFSFILARSIIDIDPAKIIRPRFVVPGKWHLATRKQFPFLRSGLSAFLILGILGAFQFVLSTSMLPWDPWRPFTLVSIPDYWLESGLEVWNNQGSLLRTASIERR
jgi:hypothetical protein